MMICEHKPEVRCSVQVIVITVRPRLRVLMTSSLTGPPRSLPLLSWQFVVIQNPSFNKVVDPVLTFARHDTIHFYQVTILPILLDMD